MRRSLSPRKNSNNKNYDLQVAKSNLEYVFSHLESPRYVLLPEINILMGKVYERLGEGFLAIRYYQKAIDIKADFPQGYAVFSDYYKRQGDLEMARELLVKGMEQNPDSIILKRRIDRLNSGS